MGREIGGLGLPRVVGGVQATRELDQAFPVEGEVTLDLTNQVGDVFVEGTDDGQVVVEALVTAYGANAADAEAAADRTEVIATQEDAGRIRVIGRYPQSSTFRGRSPNVRFTVRVPRNCAVVVQNNVGRVQVDDIEGTVNARTDVGDVEIRNLIMRGDTQVRVNVGRIVVDLTTEEGFLVNARTNVGDIDSEFQVRGASERRAPPGDELIGEVGDDPQHTLDLQTRTGDISILSGD